MWNKQTLPIYLKRLADSLKVIIISKNPTTSEQAMKLAWQVEIEFISDKETKK